mmetsp:Transcript_45725/g.97211  ORF Transcript_45725/g.97211 Transcript_45725/m.97211 type:complete len:360 (-) Transcript_45725:116-1195(-)
MTDTWDDSDDEWDKSDDDDELDRRLGLTKIDDSAAAPPPAFDDEDEDLTLKEKEANERASKVQLKAKGSALARKKAADAAAKEELELARKAMEMEAEMEANMTPEERRQKEREREESDAMAMADDLFGGVDDRSKSGVPGGPGKVMTSGDRVVLKDLKDHLRHAKKVGECIQVSLSAERFDLARAIVATPLPQSDGSSPSPDGSFHVAPRDRLNHRIVPSNPVRYPAFDPRPPFHFTPGTREGQPVRGVPEGGDPAVQGRARRRGHHRHHQILQRHQEREGAAGEAEGEGAGPKVEEGGQGGEEEGHGHQRGRVRGQRQLRRVRRHRRGVRGRLLLGRSLGSRDRVRHSIVSSVMGDEL